VYWQRVACYLICWRGPGERETRRTWLWLCLRCAESWSGSAHGQDVLDACAKRDLGTIIAVLNAHGLTQGQISELTGILQGRLSEYARRKRMPKASTTFEAFADGLGMPPAARRALGLAAEPSGSTGISLAHSRKAPDLDAGLEYPGTPAQAAGNVSMLWRADLADQGVIGRGLINPAAWTDVSLRSIGPLNGAGERIRTADLPLTRSMLPGPVSATCTDDTRKCHRCTQNRALSRRSVPRLVPRRRSRRGRLWKLAGLQAAPGTSHPGLTM
jgi:transcriptional regulator with XRE-family HTH domain